VLPLVNAAVFLATVEVGAMEGMQLEQQRQMKMVFRALAFGMPVVTYYFPSGVLVYWVTSSTWSLAQVPHVPAPLHSHSSSRRCQVPY
jgi:YidC/Oxa1 family membrane protein insertase